MAGASQLWPYPRESKDGERMHGYLLAVDEALDWDVDESAHDNPKDENHRRRQAFLAPSRLRPSNASARHSKTKHRKLPWELRRRGMLRINVADGRCCGACATHQAS
jgi:hypothetical protein